MLSGRSVFWARSSSTTRLKTGADSRLQQPMSKACRVFRPTVSPVYPYAVFSTSHAKTASVYSICQRPLTCSGRKSIRSDLASDCTNSRNWLTTRGVERDSVRCDSSSILNCSLRTLSGVFFSSLFITASPSGRKGRAPSYRLARRSLPDCPM